MKPWIEKACFPSGISYLLSSGRSGTITDPRALRIFYTRLFYAKTNHNNPRGCQGKGRQATETR
jgi:hypothetical protein